MAETKKLNPTAAIGAAVIGAVMMVGGMFAYSNKTFKDLEAPLANMGIDVNFGKAIAVIGVFLILFKVIELFFFNPLHEAIDGRTTELENTFSEAENLRTEMAQMKTDYESRLTETEAKAREEIQAQIKEATDLKKSLMADAQKQAEDYKATAISEIEAEKNKTLTELRVHVANLSLQATEKILGANIDAERNKALVNEFLDQVEAKN